MGTQWINSLYPIIILLTVLPFVWSIPFKKKLSLREYLQILKSRKWFFVINIVLGAFFIILVMANKEKFLWYIGLVTNTTFRPYDNYYPTLALSLFMVFGGITGLIVGLVTSESKT